MNLWVQPFAELVLPLIREILAFPSSPLSVKAMIAMTNKYSEMGSYSKRKKNGVRWTFEAGRR